MYASVPGTSPTAVSVSAPSNWARPKSSSRTEIPVAVLEQDVRRLDVSVDDASSVCMRERVENLRRDLDRFEIRDGVRAESLANGATGDVLVGDVDVPGVVTDVVRPHAALVAQTPCRERLTLGSSGGLSLARNDLERDVEARHLVLRKPDGAVPSASEGAYGPVAVEDQLPGGKGMCERRHR